MCLYLVFMNHVYVGEALNNSSSIFLLLVELPVLYQINLFPLVFLTRENAEFCGEEVESLERKKQSEGKQGFFGMRRSDLGYYSGLENSDKSPQCLSVCRKNYMD